MDGMGDRPVSHHATVYEHVLRPAGRPLIDQRGRIARDTHTGGLLLHFDQIGSLAVDLEESVRQLRWSMPGFLDLPDEEDLLDQVRRAESTLDGIEQAFEQSPYLGAD